jgi:predicted outer membrane repeat protein
VAYFHPSVRTIVVALVTLAGHHMACAATIYVNPDCGSDSSTGASPTCGGGSGPKLTIAAAITAAASSGETIIELADGLYTGTGNEGLSFGSKQIVLRSANGPNNCTIHCGAGLFLTCGSSTHAGAAVRGLSITSGDAGQAGYGGAVNCMGGGSPAIVNCVFEWNAASVGGGALALGNGSDATVVGCTFRDNTAARGGAIYVTGSGTNPQFTHCLFISNAALTSPETGGAVHSASSADPSFINCTFVGNIADTGSAIYLDSPADVINCIVWDNTGASSGIGLGTSGAVTALRSDIQDLLWPGTGNISEDPVFVGASDFRLDRTSPCRNTGDDASVPADTADLDGDSNVAEDAPDLDWDERIQYGDVDMGCYEYRCVADFSENCIVDVGDFEVFIDAVFLDWDEDGYTPYPPYIETDLNRDHRVDSADIIAFFANWGECPDSCSGVFQYPGTPTLEDDTWDRPLTGPAQSIAVTMEATDLSDPSPDAGDFNITATLCSSVTVTLLDDSDQSTDGQRMYIDQGGGADLDVNVQVATPTDEDESSPYGFDVTYTIENIGTTAENLPELYIPGHQLDYALQSLDHSFGDHFVTPPLSGTLTITDQNRYPGTRYAPAAVVIGTMPSASCGSGSVHVAVGASLKYPVLLYKHHVSVEFRSTATTAGQSWHTRVRLMAEGGSETGYAQIQPGETRVYTVSIRYVFPSNAEISGNTPYWIYTLKPYRDYFWSMYGNKAKYLQDLRPVWGHTMAQCGYEYSDPNNDNERGFENVYWSGVPHWVDDDGWCFVVCNMQHYLENIGRHERIMIWKPSGLYNFYSGPTPATYCDDANPGPLVTDSICCWLHYPPQIMSEWLGQMAPTASVLLDIEDTYGGEPSVDLGYWWGWSSKYAESWPDDELDPLDITNATHVLAAFNELDLAEDRGAHSIGLDSLAAMPVWDALPWMTQLYNTFPTLRYVVEPDSCDLLHLHVPFATDYTNLYAIGASGDVPHPSILADYLVPGRETWIILDNNTDYADPEHAALMLGWGLTPVSFGCELSMKDMYKAVQCAAANLIHWDWDETSFSGLPSAVSTAFATITTPPTNPFTGDPFTDLGSFTPATCGGFPSSCEYDLSECDPMAAPISPDTGYP